MQNTKTILFDFFGTLVSYSPGSFFKNHRRETYTFMAKNGLSLSYDEWKELFIRTFSELSEKAKKTHKEFHMDSVMKSLNNGHKQKPFTNKQLNVFTNMYLEEWSKDVYELPNIHNFLEKLSTRYELGIVSNTHFPTLIQYNLKRFGMEKYFTHITTSVEYGRRKPHLSIFKNALKEMHAIESEAIFIGDNYYEDYLGAKKANIKTYLIDPDRRYLNLRQERTDSIMHLQKLL
jgi:putative hydrolase of the HAD superfamily